MPVPEAAPAATAGAAPELRRVYWTIPFIRSRQKDIRDLARAHRVGGVVFVGRPGVVVAEGPAADVAAFGKEWVSIKEANV